MKIPGNAPPYGRNIGEVHTNGTDPAQHPVKSGPQGHDSSDRVHLSARARELAERVSATAALPEVRAEKIEAARTSIARGTYRVDPDRIAGRILDELA